MPPTRHSLDIAESRSFPAASPHQPSCYDVTKNIGPEVQKEIAADVKAQPFPKLAAQHMQIKTTDVSSYIFAYIYVRNINNNNWLRSICIQRLHFRAGFTSARASEVSRLTLSDISHGFRCALNVGTRHKTKPSYLVTSLRDTKTTKHIIAMRKLGSWLI